MRSFSDVSFVSAIVAVPSAPMRWIAPLFVLLLGLPACAPHRAAQWAQSPHSPGANSVEARPIRVWSRNAPAIVQANAPRVLIVGGIHGDEPEALGALPALRAALLNTAPVNIRFIEDLNPDGTARRTRTNANAVDLNRNWPTANFAARSRHGKAPLSEPESRFLFQHINEFRPNAIIVYHSARNGPFVNFDGPAEHLARAFADAAHASDPRWHVRASMGYPTPGSLGTWAGVERQIPILTIEFARGHDPALVERAIVDGTTAALATLASDSTPPN
jgi:protein MpaA